MEDFKLVVVGDGAVGKSCLLIASQTGSFPGEYIPTVFDNYSTNILVDKRAYNVGLWDTAGQEDYDRLRPLAYPQTDAFLLCFDVTNRNSFVNIEQKWIPEVRHHSPDSANILVATKIDLRSNTTGSSRSSQYVTFEEGNQLARKLGISNYLECSALTHEGIQAVIPTAVRTAVREGRLQNESHYWFLGKKIFSRKKTDSESNEPKPPVMPPAGPAPRIEVTTSTFADEWRKGLTDQNSSCTDAKFIIGPNNLVIHAHKIILASSSVIFKEIFLNPKKSNQVPKKYTQLFDEIKWIHDNQSGMNFNNLNLPTTGIDTTKDSECVEITLNKTIHYDVFTKILEFLYAGLPGFSEVEDEDFVKQIKDTAGLFRLDWLVQVCENRLNDEAFLNPSIGTWLNDEIGSDIKRLFLNKPQMSDVRFRVEEKLVYAHKAVLMARCDVMAAMLGGAFAESRNSAETEIKDANPESFLAVLEYLYTDHAPIEEGDAIEIMVIADRFCLPRLVTMCELYITKKVDRMIQKKVSDSTEYVVNLLMLSQVHNAPQLSNWCLHFIASNYSVFESSPFFSLVEGANKEYVEEHRWPPLSYFDELQEYENKMGNTSKENSKCIVM